MNCIHSNKKNKKKHILIPILINKFLFKLKNKKYLFTNHCLNSLIFFFFLLNQVILKNCLIIFLPKCFRIFLKNLFFNA